jgi:two-component system, NarL family, sensor kinase
MLPIVYCAFLLQDIFMLSAINDIDLFIIGSVVMMLLFGSFFVVLILSQRKKIRYQQSVQELKEEQQNQLIESAVKSEETERHRIAEQLHDEVGAILSAAKLHVAGINSNHLSDKEAGLHSKSKELLDEAIQKVRSISHNLHSNILREFGLNEAIRHFVKITAGSMINTSINLDEKYTAKDAEGDISTYRLVQELVQNILKHARPTELNVSSKAENNLLCISIKHNGKGLTQQDFESLRFKTDGMGLRNIQNRLILLKGNIEFSKREDTYTISLFIPKK